LQQVERAKSTKEAEELSYNTFAQRLAEETTQARLNCSRDVEAVLSEKDQRTQTSRFDAYPKPAGVSFLHLDNNC
jgi:hypothetical protein